MTDAPGPDAPAYEHLDYMGTDGQKWAHQFMMILAQNPLLLTEDGDGFMTGWFANAIEAGKQERYKRSIPQLAFAINSTAHDKGWWKDGRAFDGVLMLIVSEAAEALEEWRNNKREDADYFSMPSYRPALAAYENEELRERVGYLEVLFSDGKAIERRHLEDFTDSEVEEMIMKGHLKPEGIPSELADIVIRVFDCAVEYGIDIEEQIINKMAYNATRQYKHGGKRS